MSQYQLKKEYETQTKSVMPAVHVHAAMADSTTESMETQLNVVLPRHPLGHNKIFLSGVVSVDVCYYLLPEEGDVDFNTTYTLNYPPPYDIKRNMVKTEEADEQPSNFRRRQSEFTDLAGYKRRGRNTWQNDIGVQGRVRVTSKDWLTHSNPIWPHKPP